MFLLHGLDITKQLLTHRPIIQKVNPPPPMQPQSPTPTVSQALSHRSPELELNDNDNEPNDLDEASFVPDPKGDDNEEEDDDPFVNPTEENIVEKVARLEHKLVESHAAIVSSKVGQYHLLV